MNSSHLPFALAAMFAFTGIGCRTKTARPSSEPHQAKDDGGEAKKVEFRPERQFKSAEGQQLIKEFKELQPQIEKATDRLVLFAECGDPEGKSPTRIERVKDADSWPDDRLVMYVFLLDAENHVRLMQIVPVSESGDWYGQDDFLFEPSGALRYWERFLGAIDSDGPSKSWYAYAWNQTGSVIDKATLSVDAQDKPWKSEAPKGPELPATKLNVLLRQHKLAEALAAAKVRLPETD